LKRVDKDDEVLEVYQGRAPRLRRAIVEDADPGDALNAVTARRWG